MDASAVSVGGVATLNLTAENTGPAGNLQPGQQLTITSQIPGATTTATVTSLDNTGANEESDDNYRIRVLDAIRNQGGGGNSADYREWAQEVNGVVRAYPYAGRPFNDFTPPAPPDRTVYVEADTSIDPDGIAPPSLLDQVRDSITADPNTGITRQPLGLTDETLFIESIRRTAFFVEVRNLNVSPDIEGQVKNDIIAAVSIYFLSLRPFVDGLDFPDERNDLITDLTISEVVQGVIGSVGGSADGVGFGTAPAVFIPSFQLGQGEMAKSGGVTFA